MRYHGPCAAALTIQTPGHCEPDNVKKGTQDQRRCLTLTLTNADMCLNHFQELLLNFS